MRIAIYPGTFDPITYGHVDVAERAAKLFDKVIICVAVNTLKAPLFTGAERVELIKDAVKDIKNIEVEEFEGLLVDYAKKKKADAIVRGLRAVSDFEYEFQMALTNRKLCSDINTVFLMPHENYTYLNSTIVREIASFDGDVSGFVPPNVKKRLEEKYRDSKTKLRRK
ncbi:MAG: pantetheine-phosphate adenylyltransferase [Bacteroidetes bacterium]|nr:pantetheine-phosphate adenylyltransferase [Bacteroidota bacterium]MCL5737659.1 pantetheine-phosphate adenylyltransferase [Bacteroidota bacterium]